MQLRSPMPYIYDFEIDGMYKPSGTFKNPADIFIDKQFNVWIADTGNNRMLKFDEQGDFLRRVRHRRGRGPAERPEGIYISRAGEIWVADRGERADRAVRPGRQLRQGPGQAPLPAAGGGPGLPAQQAGDRPPGLHLRAQRGGRLPGHLPPGLRGRVPRLLRRQPPQVRRRAALHPHLHHRGPDEADLQGAAHPPRQRLRRPAGLHLHRLPLAQRDQIKKLNSIGNNVYTTARRHSASASGGGPSSTRSSWTSPWTSRGSSPPWTSTAGGSTSTTSRPTCWPSSAGGAPSGDASSCPRASPWAGGQDLRPGRQPQQRAGLPPHGVRRAAARRLQALLRRQVR